MNLQENIRRILRENMNVRLYLLRRYDYDELNNILQNSLQIQSRNLKHYKDKTFNYFNNAVVRSITERIGEELTDGWIEDLPIPENEIYDFVESLFKDEIIKKYDDLVTNDVNLQESIRRIIREENELLLRARRRIYVIDELLDFQVKSYYKPESICRYQSGEELLEVVKYAVIDHMYWDYFGNIDDNSKEWKRIFDYFEDYINNKYGDELKKYYHINCGN